MPESVQQVMTRDPVCCDATTTLFDAADLMKSKEIGGVIVIDHGKVCGIVTDRDIVVRGVACGLDPKTTPLHKICSKQLVTISPADTVDRAVDIMRQKTIRRLPVCEGGKVVGIVSLGDLAVDLAPKSVLAKISAAPAND